MLIDTINQPTFEENRRVAERRQIGDIPRQSVITESENRQPASDRRAVGYLAVGHELRTDPVMDPDSMVATTRSEMAWAKSDFLKAVREHPAVELIGAARLTTVDITPVEADAALPGWKPVQTYIYKSIDPFQSANPKLVAATTSFIQTAMVQAAMLKNTKDPELTYLSINRSGKGKKQTLLTELVRSTDPGIDDWITNLPDAERLRPVASPHKNTPTIIRTKDGKIVEIPLTDALQALVGTAGDGRAVREREAWERIMVRDVIANTKLPDNKLVITSLGTGTGEPAMDTAIDAMQTVHGDAKYSIQVNGFDINPNSLAIAEHIAASKGDALHFVPGLANILSADGIKQVVAGTQANVYESIGFAEYVPSDDAPTEMERKQRETMKRAGCLSAQEFYGTIYEHMPKGSVLVTGNMRDDSPQASFVVEGLGWKGIIQRPTEDYLRILKGAEIPSEAVELYMPDPKDSAAVYNLVKITKL